MHKHRSQIKTKTQQQHQKRTQRTESEQQALPNRLSSHKIDCLNVLKSKQELNTLLLHTLQTFYLSFVDSFLRQPSRKTVRQRQINVRIRRNGGRKCYSTYIKTKQKKNIYMDVDVCYTHSHSFS